MSRGQRMLMLSLNTQQQHKLKTLLHTPRLSGGQRAQVVTCRRPSHSTPKKATATTNLRTSSALNFSAVSSIPDLATDAPNQGENTSDHSLLTALDNVRSAVPSAVGNNDAQFNEISSHAVLSEVEGSSHTDKESGCQSQLQINSRAIQPKHRKRQRFSIAQRAERANLKTSSRKQKYSVKTGCNSACKRKCSTFISEDQRQKINSEFWNMSHWQRRTFILHSTVPSDS